MKVRQNRQENYNYCLVICHGEFWRIWDLLIWEKMCDTNLWFHPSRKQKTVTGKKGKMEKAETMENTNIAHLPFFMWWKSFFSFRFRRGDTKVIGSCWPCSAECCGIDGSAFNEMQGIRGTRTEDGDTRTRARLSCFLSSSNVLWCQASRLLMIQVTLHDIYSCVWVLQKKKKKNQKQQQVVDLKEKSCNILSVAIEIFKKGTTLDRTSVLMIIFNFVAWHLAIHLSLFFPSSEETSPPLIRSTEIHITLHLFIDIFSLGFCSCHSGKSSHFWRFNWTSHTPCFAMHCNLDFFQHRDCVISSGSVGSFLQAFCFIFLLWKKACSGSHLWCRSLHFCTYTGEVEVESKLRAALNKSLGPSAPTDAGLSPISAGLIKWDKKSTSDKATETLHRKLPLAC